MYSDEEFIQIVDDESGDTYFYEVPIEIDNLPAIVDLRVLLDISDYE